MNMLRPIILLSAITVLSSACVSRTITRTNPMPPGGKKESSVEREKKTIWIWQDEFRNP